MKRIAIVLVGSAMLTGCFTLSETDFPKVAVHANAVAATNITLAVRGFETMLTSYTLVDGYQTVFYSGGGPYRYYGAPGVATVHTTSVVPNVRPSDAFLEQARNGLEGLGFNIMAQTPDYVVEGHFAGPMVTSGDVSKQIAWMLLSLFTCDHGAQTWTARLKVYDNHTGRLAFSRDYSQKYEVTGFSPIPIFGISCYDHTGSNYMQCWCLGALTERMTADAASFLTTGK